MPVQMLEIGLARRDQRIEISKPFKPRPRMVRAVDAQIREQVIRRQSANARALGQHDSLRRRVSIDPGKQDGVVRGPPLQLDPYFRPRLDQLDFSTKTDKRAALPLV